MSETSASDDDRFAALLDAYDTAYRANQLNEFWNRNPCPNDLRGRVENAHEALQQLDSYLTRQLIPSLTETPTDSQSRRLYQHPMQLDRFEVIREIGRGGFGIVYLAKDPSLGRQVAIKLPRVETLGTKSLQTRFAQEAEISARLDHPHIVPVFEVGNTVDGIYIVSLYCPGTNLAQWLIENHGQLSFQQIAELMNCLCSAIAYCHKRNILHRDLKPANVLLFPAPYRSLSFLPRINDFGLAKIIEASQSSTASSALLGTPLYMAPEQISSNSDAIGPATDVYGLGAILYELLTEQPPFRGTVAEILDQIRVRQPVSPRKLNKHIPIELETICLKCLSKQTQDRYPSASELLADLTAYQTGNAIVARPPTLLDKCASRLANNQTRWIGASVFLALNMLLLVLTLGSSALDLSRSTLAQWIAVFLINVPLILVGRLMRDGRAIAAILGLFSAVAMTGLGAFSLAYENAGQVSGIDLPTSNRPLMALVTLLWSMVAIASAMVWHSIAYTSARATRSRRPRTVFVLAVIPTIGMVVGLSGLMIKYQLWQHGLAPQAQNPSARAVIDEATHGSRQASYLHRAAEWLELGKFKEARQILAAYRETATAEDVQSFPWRYLNARMDSARQVFDGLTGKALCADISPDSKWIVAGDRKGDVCIWNRNGQLERSFNYLNKEVGVAKFSPDGTLLATGGQGNRVYLWRVGDWQQIAVLEELTGTITGIAWSPDSQQLVCGSRQNSVSVWHVPSATLVKRLAPTNDTVRDVAWTKDGQWVAAVVGKQLVLWKTSDWEASQQVVVGEEQLYGVTFSPDSKRVVAVGASMSFYLASVEDLNDAVSVDAKTSMRQVDWSPDGRMLAASTRDAPRIWSTENLKEIASLERQQYTHRTVRFTTDGHQLLTVTEENNEVSLWDVQPATGYRELDIRNPILAWKAMENEILCVTSNSINQTQLFRADSAQPLWEREGASVLADMSIPTKLLACLRDNTIEICSLDDARVLQSFAKPEFEIHQLSLSADGQRLLAIGNSTSWALYDTVAGSMITSAGGGEPYMEPLYEHSKDGKRFAIRSELDGDSSIEIRLAFDGQVEKRFLGERGNFDIVADPTFSTFYVANVDGIMVTDVSRDDFDHTRFRPRRGIEKLALSPDGLILAATVSGEGLYLWDVRSGQELFPILETQSKLDQLRFTSNSELVCRRQTTEGYSLLIFNCDSAGTAR